MTRTCCLLLWPPRQMRVKKHQTAINSLLLLPSSGPERRCCTFLRVILRKKLPVCMCIGLYLNNTRERGVKKRALLCARVFERVKLPTGFLGYFLWASFYFLHFYSLKKRVFGGGLEEEKSKSFSSPSLSLSLPSFLSLWQKVCKIGFLFSFDTNSPQSLLSEKVERKEELEKGSLSLSLLHHPTSCLKKLLEKKEKKIFTFKTASPD